MRTESRIRAKKARISQHHNKQVKRAVIRCNACGRSYNAVRTMCICGEPMDTATIIIHFKPKGAKNGTGNN